MFDFYCILSMLIYVKITISKIKIYQNINLKNAWFCFNCLLFKKNVDDNHTLRNRVLIQILLVFESFKRK